MADYGRALEFAVSLDPTAADHETQRALARRAESLGLDLIGMQDHPYQPRFLDTFVLLLRADHVRQLELFATEVVPAVRDAVGRARA